MRKIDSMENGRSQFVTSKMMGFQIASKIVVIRDVQVILDRDLAEIYGVETKAFNQAVKRNIERFPDFFRFQLNDEEIQELERASRSQLGVRTIFWTGYYSKFSFLR